MRPYQIVLLRVEINLSPSKIPGLIQRLKMIDLKGMLLYHECMTYFKPTSACSFDNKTIYKSAFALDYHRHSLENQEKNTLILHLEQNNSIYEEHLTIKNFECKGHLPRNFRYHFIQHRRSGRKKCANKVTNSYQRSNTAPTLT